MVLLAESVAALLVVVGLVHAPLVAAVLVNRARRQADDTLLFQQCVSRGMIRTRRLFSKLPGPPRCRICYLPFGGLGPFLFATSPSPQNPNFCRVCFERLPVGGHEMELGVLFADVRGFTTLAEKLTPEELSHLSRRFFRVATEVLIRHDAVIDGFMGDGIIGLFLPPIPTLGDRTCDEMLAAACELVHELSTELDGPPLQVGAAIHYGTAQVGNLGTRIVKEFCAVGDVVTTAARLQQRAAGGEVLVSDHAWQRLTERDASALRSTLRLRGKSSRVPVHRVSATGFAPAEAVPTGTA